MSWETRKGANRRFFYRTRRKNGRAFREYVGPGTDPLVQIIARDDALGRAEAKAATTEVRSEQLRYVALKTLLNSCEERLSELQNVNLLVCGYRRRKGRLEPVKYRDRKQTKLRKGRPTREQFEQCVRRANRGDRDAADRLWQVLHDYPEIWSEVGDLTRHTEQTLIELIGAGNPTLCGSVRLKADDLRQTLLTEATDAALEALLIDHIVISWLQTEFTRMAVLQPQQFRKDSYFWRQHYAAAGDGFLKAIRELATIRDLLGGDSGSVRGVLDGVVDTANDAVDRRDDRDTKSTEPTDKSDHRPLEEGMLSDADSCVSGNEESPRWL